MGNEEETSTTEDEQIDAINAAEHDSDESGDEENTEQETSEEETDEESDSGDDETEEGEKSESDDTQEKPEKAERPKRRETQIERLRRQKAEMAQKLATLETRVTEVLGDEPLAPEDFESDAEYDKAMLAQQVRSELMKAQAEMSQTEMAHVQEQENAAVQDAFLDRSAEFAKLVPDYEATVNTPDVAIPELAVQAVLESEMGPAILYDLAKNPDQAKRLFDMSAVQVAMEIGKMEARLSAGGITRKAPKRAPEPINPVGASGGDVTTRKYSDMGDNDFINQREKEFRQRRAPVSG